MLVLNSVFNKYYIFKRKIKNISIRLLLFTVFSFLLLFIFLMPPSATANFFLPAFKVTYS